MIDTCRIMIFCKDEQIVDVFIQKVVRKVVVELHHTFVPRRCGTESLSYRIEEREVHYRRQVGVIALYRTDRAILLPIRHLCALSKPYLAHNVEIRIFISNGFRPLGNTCFVVIRISIHTQTVEVGVFYPPNRVLGEVV